MVVLHLAVTPSVELFWLINETRSEYVFPSTPAVNVFVFKPRFAENVMVPESSSFCEALVEFAFSSVVVGVPTVAAPPSDGL